VSDYFWEFPRAMTVAERQRLAKREADRLKKKGKQLSPVEIEGRKIAKSFWGQSWCTNLERYSDYASRLPRGRSYVRSGSVLDLQIGKGSVTALVSGSDLYEIDITIKPVSKERWQAICRDCSGTIDSLVELLQGRLDRAVMERICHEGTGLFPAPKEIMLSCSCPDWAGMCKHVAAALYGVGARLDRKPEHLFLLRGVDQNELIAGVAEAMPLPAEPRSGKVLAEDDVAALFGIEMTETADMAPMAALEAADGSAGSRPMSVAKAKLSSPRRQRSVAKPKQKPPVSDRIAKKNGRRVRP
jgi:uncharacterized Zn finger protein